MSADGRIRLFQVQQPLFFVKATGIAGKLSVGAHYPVAGDDEGDGVVADCAADCLRGHLFQAHFPGQQYCYLAVSHCFSVRDAQQNLPHTFAESRSPKAEGRSKIRLLPAKIDAKPAAGGFKYRQQSLLMFLVSLIY